MAITAVVSAAFIVILAGSFNHGMIMASAQQSNPQNPCTAANPCNQQVCGDHICAPGEYVKMQQALAQAQVQSSMQNTTNATAGNNQPTSISGQNTQGQSAGQTLLGVVAYNATASDGTLVIMRTGFPISGQSLSIGIAFLDSTRNYIQNQNFAITVTQDNGVVLSNQNVNTQSGIDTLTTSVLASADPVNIKITLNGVGLPTADPSTWKGVKGEVVNFGPSASTTPTTPTTSPPTTPTTSPPTTPTTSPPTTNQNSGKNAVPEFGSIAPIVLTIAVLSIVVFTARNKGIAKL